MAGHAKIKGSAPKVRNANRAPGYWRQLAASRDHGNRAIVNRAAHTGINYPSVTETGSAAYRRRR